MSHNAEKYYVPSASYYPILGSVALLLLASGATMWINKMAVAGQAVLFSGAVLLAWMLFTWFGAVIRESENGEYGRQVDASFRWSMSWFIFSEVMFFSAFFGALLYVRVFALPDLSSLDNQNLWPGFSAHWPDMVAPGGVSTFQVMSAWGIPAINTLILLSSGAKLTWAHAGVLGDKRLQLTLGLFLTIMLGIVFLCFQVYEYAHAYQHMNLTLSSGIYGALFYMLTGFHGLHVTIGVIMLIVSFLRVLKGHFKAQHHFAFEATAWYWHFVDVVWLFLFVVVYWL
jgi:cytochrome c oxidase subunit 3